MEQPAPTAVAVGVAIPGIGVGVGNVADCPYLADAWADSFAPLVDPSDVAAGYQYGPTDRPFFGTNEGISSDDPPVVPESWMGTFCGLLPAPSAVAEGVVVPGVGVGTAEVVSVTTESTDPCPCELGPRNDLELVNNSSNLKKIELTEDDLLALPITLRLIDPVTLECLASAEAEVAGLVAVFEFELSLEVNYRFNGCPPYLLCCYDVKRSDGILVQKGDAMVYK